ncbi:hypothetical protein ACS0TY_013119 [Phlomoides rotata]
MPDKGRRTKDDSCISPTRRLIRGIDDPLLNGSFSDSASSRRKKHRRKSGYTSGEKKGILLKRSCKRFVDFLLCQSELAHYSNVCCVDNSGNWGHGGMFDALARLSAAVSNAYERALEFGDLHPADLHLIETTGEVLYL